MKTVTIALEDELYETATEQAAKSRKTLGEFLHDLFLPSLKRESRTTAESAAILHSLWALADARAETPGSAGPLNRNRTDLRE